MAAIIGETIAVDRSLIYDIDFKQHQVKGISEWLNPNTDGITAIKDTYNLDVFIDASKYMLEQRKWTESHVDDISPYAANDGSGELLHGLMEIKSGLWFPFAFRNQAYYCMVFNQVSYRRRWREEEINFIHAAATQMEIAIQKIRIQNDQRHAEIALRKNEDRLRIITDNMLDMLYLTDEDFIIKYASPSCAQSIGIKPSELTGRSIFELVHPEDMPVVLDSVNHAIKNNSGSKKTFRFQLSSEHDLWVESTIKILLDDKGSITGTVLCSRDISERKQAAEALKKSESLYRTIFENTGTATSIAGLDTILSLVNTEFEKLSGYTKKELEGIKSWTSFVLKADLQRLNNYHHLRMLSPHKAPDKFEFRFVNKAGEVRNVLMTLAQIPGTLMHLSSFLDITEIKHFQQEMSRLERLNLVGQMAAGIGHEVRNPMTTVRGFLQMFRGKSHLAIYKNHFDLMIDELDRANSIITQFLSLAKDKPVDKKIHNLNSIVEMLYPLIEADAYKSGMGFNLQLQEIPDSLLDEKEIRQLILNLTRNGIEAMSPGGTLTISTFAQMGKAVLAVQDQGTGIPSHIMEKLGTPFLTTKDEGTGLGLSVCYSIATRHNATVDVKTGPGGTTFMIKFNGQ